MPEHLVDCEKIRAIAAKELLVIISLEQAEAAWQEHSADLAAGWLNIQETAEGVSEVVWAVRFYLQKAIKNLIEMLGESTGPEFKL